MQRIQTDRNIFVYIILSIITCGIYGYYFIYKLASDVNEMCKADGESTPGLAVFIILSYITCGFYAYYWYYKLGNRLQANAPTYGLTFQESGTTILLWCVIGCLLCGLGQFYGIYLIIKNTNEMAVAYNQMNNLN